MGRANYIFISAMTDCMFDVICCGQSSRSSPVAMFCLLELALGSCRVKDIGGSGAAIAAAAGKAFASGLGRIA